MMLTLLLAFVTMGITTWLYCEYLFGRERISIPRGIGFCVGYLALTGLCFSLLQWTMPGLFFAVNWLLLRQSYQCTAKTASLHAAFLAIGGMLTMELSAIGLQAYNYSDPYMNFERIRLLPWQLYYCGLCVVSTGFFRPHNRSVVLLWGSAAVSWGVAMVLQFMVTKQELSAWGSTMVAIGECGLLVVLLLLFALYNHLEKAYAANLELQLSIQKERWDAAHYQALQEQWESQRILIHDIKSHLRTLGGLAQQSDNTPIREYLETLEATFVPTVPPPLSKEPILDMLLQRTRKDCEKKGLIFRCDVRQGCTAFMDAPAITALYGNLLSNALEGAEGSQGRTVELRVTNNPQGVVLSLVNDCDTPPKTDSFGRLITKKQDPQAHGVGMKSIERVLRRYGGIQTLYYDETSRRFHHVIHFSQEKGCGK